MSLLQDKHRDQEQQCQDQGEALCDDVLYDVLRCVDGDTLAVLGCVSSTLRCVSRDEALWEKLCASQWPSTCGLNARQVINSVGGFRKLYSECSRLISVPEALPYAAAAAAITEFDEFPDLTAASSNFASMVDVVFKEQVLFSKFIDGIPGTDDFGGWFLGCPFRVDLLHPLVGSEESSTALLPDARYDDEQSFVECERKYGKVWKEIWNNLKLSWILVNKETKQVANVSSWNPVTGQKHWPTNRDFVLRYGSIVTSSLPKPVECSIILKCKVVFNENRNSSSTSASAVVPGIRLTELSMQLKEALSDEHLNGRFGLFVLEQAAASVKSRDREGVLRVQRECLKLQSEFKVQEMQHAWHMDVYAFFLVVAIVALFLLRLIR